MKRDVLVIDWKDAAMLKQPFEHEHEYNVVVFPTKVELRQLQQLELGMTKYIIHTERFEGMPGENIDTKQFLLAFVRARDIDPIDIRKAIRWALKGSYTISPPSVV
jgi:hypothetical protein